MRHDARRAAGAILAALALAACGRHPVREAMLGRATVRDSEHLPAGEPAPSAIWVGDFPAAEGAMRPAGGLFGMAEHVVEERPRILPTDGPLVRRVESDHPDAATVSDALASSIADGLAAAKLGMPVERLPAGGATPTGGWLVHGQIVSVDPGNRAERAVVGFGAGDATAQVAVDVDRLGGDVPTRLLAFGAHADSGASPGGVVTLNPYVMAAKFVLGRDATMRDVRQLGGAIADELAGQIRTTAR